MGYHLPSAYRQPCLTREEAQPLAEQAIARQRGNHPDHTLGLIRLVRDEPLFWTFGSLWEPPVMIEGGGMAYARIDKLDGHPWTTEESERFHREQA